MGHPLPVPFYASSSCGGGSGGGRRRASCAAQRVDDDGGGGNDRGSDRNIFIRSWRSSRSKMDRHTEDTADDGFTSITWDSPPGNASSPPPNDPMTSPGFQQPGHSALPEHPHQAPPGHAMDDPVREGQHSQPQWRGRWMQIEIRDPVKEHEGTKDSYVSYCVKTRVRFGVSGSFAPLDRILMATISTIRCADKRYRLSISPSCSSETFPRLCLPQRTPRQSVPCVRRTSHT
jgi:sorting nexin-4